MSQFLLFNSWTYFWSFQPSFRATLWRRSTIRWSRSSRSSRVRSSGFSPRRSYEDRNTPSAPPLLSLDSVCFILKRKVDLQTAASPLRPSSPPAPPRSTTRHSGWPECCFILYFCLNQTPLLGFLTSRAKHTGSMMTSHSTRYSSLMFKGGELKRRRRRVMKVARRNVRNRFYLLFFCLWVFSLFLSCKVSVDGRTEFQSQAASVGPEEGGDTKSKTLHVWALTACHLIPPFISHQPLHLSVWRHSFSSSVLLSFHLFF